MQLRHPRSRLSRPQLSAGAATCPTCNNGIAAEDLNMSEGAGLCRACNKLFRLSELTQANETQELIEQSQGEPPAGTWASDNGNEQIYGASTRSIGGFLAALAICLFWNGIVSVFVLVNLASTLKLLGVQLPAWFPAPKMNGGAMGAGMTIFLWIFLTPFLLVGAAIIAGMFMCLAGRVEVIISQNMGKVFSGVGPFGYTKRFDPTSVRSIQYEDKKWTDSDGDKRTKTNIVIEADKRIEFGSMLPKERQRFLAGRLAARFQS
jgi:hypothetical protein